MTRRHINSNHKNANIECQHHGKVSKHNPKQRNQQTQHATNMVIHETMFVLTKLQKYMQCFSHDTLHLKYIIGSAHDLHLQQIVQCFCLDMLQLKYLIGSSHDLNLQQYVQWPSHDQLLQK